VKEQGFYYTSAETIYHHRPGPATDQAETLKNKLQVILGGCVQQYPKGGISFFSSFKRFGVREFVSSLVRLLRCTKSLTSYSLCSSRSPDRRPANELPNHRTPN